MKVKHLVIIAIVVIFGYKYYNKKKAEKAAIASTVTSPSNPVTGS